jgi:hypothetical protein
VGHALAGVAAAWLTGGRLRREPRDTPSLRLSGQPLRRPLNLTGLMAEVALFSAAAIAPDLDLLFGTHSTYSHSVGAVLIVFALTLAVGGAPHRRIALGVAAAWGSHILLDWCGSDTSPPIGVMALWPFDYGYYQSPVSIFDAISRRYWLPDQFIWGNLRAALKEIILLAPLSAAAYVWRRRCTKSALLGSDSV